LYRNRWADQEPNAIQHKTFNWIKFAQCRFGYMRRAALLRCIAASLREII